MAEIRFKTNIDCGGCVKAVTPFLSKVEAIEKWEVDTSNKDKVLTVKSDKEVEQQVADAVKKAGFTIERI